MESLTPLAVRLFMAVSTILGGRKRAWLDEGIAH